MNAAMRIQIMVDARQARAQINQIRGQLSAISKVVVSSQKAVAKAQDSALRAQATRQAQATRRAVQLEEQKLKAAQRVVASQEKLDQNLAANKLKNAQTIVGQQDRIRQADAASQAKHTARLIEQQRKSSQNVNANAAKNAQNLVAQRQRQNAQLEQAEAKHQVRLAEMSAKAASNVQTNDDKNAINRASQNARAKLQLAAAATKAGMSIAAYMAKLRANNTATDQAVQKTNALARAYRSLAGALTAGVGHLDKVGDRLRFVGRQATLIGRSITQTITLPVFLLGRAGTSMALDLDRAMTRVKKVYGDVAVAGEDLAARQSKIDAETKELKRTFFALSDMFGMHVEDVANIGAEWAQAGAKGTVLQEVTKDTMEAMLLGDLAADQAVEGLITLMTAFGLTAQKTDEAGNVLDNSLTMALATFNAVENETAVSMQDLITGVSKAGSVAREGGVDIRHLAAMMAALVPSTGDAAEAGNALKTILLQIGAPTGVAASALKQLGINVEGTSWRSKNLVERLDEISKASDRLTQTQKLEFSRSVANLRQSNKFLALLDDMINKQGNYQKALDVTADKMTVLQTYEKELGDIMASDSQRFSIYTNRLRNTLIQAILPLLPALNNLMAWIAGLANKFRELDPHVQKMIMGFLLFLAISGPVLMYVGALSSGLGALFNSISWVIAGIAGLAGVSAGTVVIVGAIAAAVLALAFLFRDELAQAIQWIGNGLANFFKPLMPLIHSVMSGIVRVVNAGLRLMPQSFANAFIAVVNVVKAAAKAVYSWLSWMNPFARHSPSLVEQVEGGTQVIANAYDWVADSVAGSMNRVSSMVRNLTASIAKARQAAEAAQMAENIKFAVAAGADAGEVRALIDLVAEMNVQLVDMKSGIDSQKATVDAWKERLDAANKTLDAANDTLSDLKGVVSDLDDELSSAKNRLSDWLNAPVAGTYAFEDAIFSNEMAQTSLKLQIAQLEKQVVSAGYSIDDVRQYMEDQAKAAQELAGTTTGLNSSLEESGLTADDTKSRMAALRGEIETLRGEALDLRLQGAGSDVLSGLQWQIDQAEKTSKNLAQNLADPAGTTKPPANVVAMVEQIDKLKTELDSLSLDGEILDLEKALALEPAQKAIKDTQRIAEQSLSAILAGIQTESAAIDDLTQRRDAATAAVERQQVVVDSLTASRDAIQATYDAESEKLDRLQKQYDTFSDSVSNAQKELDAAFKLGEDILKAKEDAANAGPIGGAGDFATPGSAGSLAGLDGGGLGDMQAFTDDILKQIEDSMGKFDPVGAIKKKIQDFKDWLASGGGAVIGWLDQFLGPMKDDLLSFFEPLKQPLLDAWNAVWSFLKDDVWGPISDNILPKIDQFVEHIQEKLGPLQEALGNLWQAVKEKWDLYAGPLFQQIQDAFGILVEALTIGMPVIGALWDTFTELVGNAIQTAADILGGFITILTGIINVIAGLLTGDLGLIWEGVKQIFSGAIQVILGIVLGGFNTMWILVKGAFEAVWALVKSIWESFGAPIFSGAWNWIKTNFIDKITGIPTTISDAFRSLGGILGGIFTTVKNTVASGINSVIGIINSLSRGVNSVASALGLSFRIGMIGQVATANSIGNNAMPMATGGVIPSARVGSGFVTNGARAIVGEGSTNHPEFVIPTDPKYRGRALGLAASLMARLGYNPTGQYAGGGVLSSVGSFAAGGASSLFNKAASTARDAAGRVGGLPGQFGRAAIETIIGGAGKKVAQWVADKAKALASTIMSPFTATKNLLGSIMPFESGGVLPIHSLADGGVVKATRGGVLTRLAEAGYDEAVVPLDRHARNGGKQGTYNFYGDLSFPNVQNGSDAKDFLDNLEALGD